MRYGFAARDHLIRAQDCLSQEDPKFLFYAAFELRCAVESRMREYLEAWDHVSKKQKNGWEIAKLGSATEKAFRTDKYQRWKIFDPDTHATLMVLYYTPVTKELQNNAKLLGDYLHSQKRSIPPESPWWAKFRSLLDEMVEQVDIATTGTLLGPAMLRDGKIDMNTSLPNGTAPHQLFSKGSQSIVNVDYLDRFPSELEPEALVWK
jgi:hypothetical protein